MRLFRIHYADIIRWNLTQFQISAPCCFVNLINQKSRILINYIDGNKTMGACQFDRSTIISIEIRPFLSIFCLSQADKFSCLSISIKLLLKTLGKLLDPSRDDPIPLGYVSYFRAIKLCKNFNGRKKYLVWSHLFLFFIILLMFLIFFYYYILLFIIF